MTKLAGDLPCVISAASHCGWQERRLSLPHRHYAQFPSLTRKALDASAGQNVLNLVLFFKLKKKGGKEQENN